MKAAGPAVRKGMRDVEGLAIDQSVRSGEEEDGSGIEGAHVPRRAREAVDRKGEENIFATDGGKRQLMVA